MPSIIVLSSCRCHNSELLFLFCCHYNSWCFFFVCQHSWLHACLLACLSTCLPRCSMDYLVQFFIVVVLNCLGLILHCMGYLCMEIGSVVGSNSGIKSVTPSRSENIQAKAELEIKEDAAPSPVNPVPAVSIFMQAVEWLLNVKAVHVCSICVFSFDIFYILILADERNVVDTNTLCVWFTHGDLSELVYTSLRCGHHFLLKTCLGIAWIKNIIWSIL